MNERERTALAEAIEHCAMHNSEYQHYTPAAKIAEWQNVLGESISAAQLDAAVTEGERDASGQAESPAATAAREMLRYPSRYDAPAGLLSSDALHSRPPGLESGVAVREPYRAGPAGFKLAEHRARILDALLTDIDRTREQHGSEERIERLAHAVATLAGAPL